MAGEGIRIGTGQGAGFIEPKGSMIGVAGNANINPVRKNRLNRRKRKGNGLSCPKIPTRKGGK